LTAHEAGDAIPTGWELIRKAAKKKAFYKQAPSATKAKGVWIKGVWTPDPNLPKAQVDKAVEHQWQNK